MKRKEPLGSDRSDVEEIMREYPCVRLCTFRAQCAGACAVWHGTEWRWWKTWPPLCQSSPTALANTHRKERAWRHGGCGGGTTTCAEVVTSPRFPPLALCCGLKRERIRINPRSKPRSLQVKPSEASCEWACRTTAYGVLPQQLTSLKPQKHFSSA